ncbi:glycoside hydrolase family 43 protein [Paenibacillus sp. R14(2021)]|uniref:glycoside hydrolase family 43 protein n=1 Tax=Paenibacillus sp. R14(2021) TaxID=2859228 RepID=UPI001C613E2F|nr:glycoside hydrolase family 43 protein [Paenibacillus sp. R14(2021)]
MPEQRSSASLPVMGEKTYKNPLPVKGPNGSAPTAGVLPDPYVLKHKGVYYAYATGQRGVSVLFSRDGIDWEHRGYAYSREGSKEYWAPAVIYDNGMFYMYVSAMPEGEDDVHEERLLVASSPAAEGPFLYVKTFFDTFSLDAHVVKDEQGDYFMYYSNNEYMGVDGERPGTVILVDRMTDPLTLEGNPQLVVAPTIDEEIYEENRFGDGRNWHTIEGAFYLRRGSKHYMMYSGNAYVRPNYFLGYSVADASEGKPQSELSWRKYPSDDTFEPLLSKNEGVEGVGHNSVVRGPNNVDEWVYYHGRNAEDELDFNREQRTMRTDPLLWSGDDMYVAGPSYALQDAPALPAFRDLFESPGGEQALSTAWEVLSGTWQAANGEALQTERSAVRAAVTKETFGSIVMEVSLNWQHDHRGGLYGLYPCYASADDYVITLLDVGQRLLVTYAVSGGVKHAVKEVRLPRDFRFDVFHLLRVERTGTRYVIQLDGVTRVEADFPLSEGRAGLVTLQTSAAFAGVEITRHIALEERMPEGFASRVKRIEGQGAAEVRGGAVTVRSARERSAWLIDEPIGWSGGYRFAFDFNLDAGGTGIGGYAVHGGATGAVEMLADRASALLKLTLIREGAASLLGKVPVPADFNWSRSHTVDVTFRPGKLTVRLDRIMLFAGEVPVMAGAPGLIAQGNAAFRNIRVTGV